ncbi:Retrovirus-related Pol polyprotein from transposon RE2 [Vitis vinifera]|uniref:Retrovirus-related Pol polyprotein from transposon RE2 n=1 Tax=Vitis vinifera TaxID=29760 RepID=A0A438F0N1_VITVI|nr:Retrovirus-related Pol polyprotein from transposon RE2 [Vitis vinifera]
MATENSQLIIPNAQEPTKPLTMITIHNSIKLTPTNYLSWKTQMEAILIGYDLQKFIDGSHPAPPTTITTNNVVSTNPAYQTWLRQDKLLFRALVGTLSSTLVPLITQSKTSYEAWQILANTYARPSRGHIKQLKDHLKNITKGSQSITDYMQSIKTRADELATLGKPLDQEDLIEKVLEGLDENYQSIIDAVNGCDSTISFDELHEKLINKELSLRNKISPSPLPASAHATNVRFTPWSVTNRTPRLPGSTSAPTQGIIRNSPTNTRDNRSPARPFLGRCQWCSTQGHVVSRCPLFRQQFQQVQPPSRPGNSSQSRPPAPWQAQANVTTTIPPNTTWLLDSGASHHVTTDLHNLALHSPFDGTDEIMISDGSGLPISHTGSTSLTTPLIPLLYLMFYDLHTGAILLQGRTKDGVYEWPLSTTQSRPLIAFSSVKTTLSEWHHRLALSSFLTINGVSHLTSPPHTPEHNGYSERRHRHIVETGLSLLTHASMPLSYWPFAFSTAVYLINPLDVSAILGFAHTHPTNSSLVPPLASLSGTLPLKVPIYVLTHPPLVYTLPVMSALLSQSFPLSLLILLFLAPLHPPSLNDPSQNNTTCATPTPEPDSHSSVPVPETKCDCANNPPLPPTQNDPNQPPDLSPSPHVIVTRSKHNIHKPIQKLNLTAQLQQPTLEPTTVTQALKDPKWRQAMSAEFDALLRNGIWDLVPSHPTQNLSVIKPTTVRLVLSLAVSQGWSLRQLDVNNAFLQGTLTEDVFMSQPPGFIDRDPPHHVCKLRKAIYGLKQAPRAWYHELRQFLLQFGFINSIADTSLFIFNNHGTILYLLVYVDDIIITGNNVEAAQTFIQQLSQRFSLKDLGPLTYFLGVETHMTEAKPAPTPLATSPILTLQSGTPLSDPTEYRTVVGSLQYLSLTRPDIAYTVNKLSQFMHQPTSDHWNAVKRLLRYLCGTLDHGITLRRTSPLALHAFSDSDWAGNKDDFTSTSAYIIYLGHNPISWSSKNSELWLALPLRLNTDRWPLLLQKFVGFALSSPNSVSLFPTTMSHISASDQLADALTKPLARPQFDSLKAKIGLAPRSSILRGHDKDIQSS